ncbi:MAG: glyoxylase-like metal-dependent hydrolase (beta-lactamase superfamily II) [Planctomycetaceae bacterium]|jgi:glyoxylase-like metal-dependent hydrolase (beta-lactamase superfamily II)
MRLHSVCVMMAVLVGQFAVLVDNARAEEITARLTFLPGPVNGVVVGDKSRSVAVYSVPESMTRGVSTVLLTSHRRDAVTAAEVVVAAGATVIAPEAERGLFESTAEFWDGFWTKRFHDYAQQSTKILTTPLKVGRYVKDGDTFDAGGVSFRVLETPGFTRGAVSYIAEIDGKRVAFTGDLIYGDGQLFDLYSFQDAIPEAKIGGYHGHASRLALLIPSLKKIAAEKPDLIIPARGPVIRNPQEAIAKLIGRVEAYYRNYLSTNALNWYFKEERMTIKGRRVLGQDAEVKLMPLSVHKKTPDWIWENSTSRMLISDDGHGFLLDCGYQRVLDGVKQLMKDGLVKKVDGIFVTHYHDDHTNMVQAAAEEFGCPIYATLEYEDILENPGAYHMPATTDKAMKDVTGLKSGHKMKWKEFDIEFQFYPGQALYHGAILVRRNGGTPYYFVGDAFSPSGMDDYCLLNRNLLHDDAGYPFCLKKVRELGSDYWLINEHIPYVFRFSEKELDYLETNLQKRKEILDELLPWDDINYGIDEQWATFYPRGAAATAGEPVELEVRILNHSPIARTFKVTPRKSRGIDILSKPAEITLQPRQSGSVAVNVSVRKPVTLPGTFAITADIDSDGMHFLSWADAVIRVED